MMNLLLLIGIGLGIYTILGSVKGLKRIEEFKNNSN